MLRFSGSLKTSLKSLGHLMSETFQQKTPGWKETHVYTKEILRLTINALKREIALNFPYTQEFLGIGTISHLYYLLLLTFVL